MFPSNTSNGVGKKWSGTKKFTDILCHNFDKIQGRVMSSCLEMGLIVANKYVSFKAIPIYNSRAKNGKPLLISATNFDPGAIVKCFMDIKYF